MPETGEPYAMHGEVSSVATGNILQWKTMDVMTVQWNELAHQHCRNATVYDVRTLCADCMKLAQATACMPRQPHEPAFV